MELKEAIEKLKNLQDWYKEGNMSTTIESSELEALCVVLQALENSISKDKLVEAIDFAINATDSTDDYSIGLCNGMIYVKALLTDGNPDYKKCQKNEEENTYEFGLVVGTKRERDYWKNKIKEKIEELELQRSGKWCWEQQEEIKQIEILEELLKGE